MGAAFAYTIEKRGVIGSMKFVIGTFTPSGGSTGGDIVTGLNKVYDIKLQHTGAAVVASAPSVNETLPLSSGTVKIVTVADSPGTFYAIGK
jgi:hypothetical protein